MVVLLKLNALHLKCFTKQNNKRKYETPAQKVDFFCFFFNKMNTTSMYSSDLCENNKFVFSGLILNALN